MIKWSRKQWRYSWGQGWDEIKKSLLHVFWSAESVSGYYFNPCCKICYASWRLDPGRCWELSLGWSIQVLQCFWIGLDCSHFVESNVCWVCLFLKYKPDLRCISCTQLQLILIVVTYMECKTQDHALSLAPWSTAKNYTLKSILKHSCVNMTFPTAYWNSSFWRTILCLNCTLCITKPTPYIPRLFQDLKGRC